MDYSNARINARPTETDNKLEPGLHSLNLGTHRDGLIYVPRGLRKRHPLLVLLHGSGGKASHMLIPFKELAEESGTLLLIPESQSETWDIVRGEYGPDVKFLNEAFVKVFHEMPIDPKKIAVGGFSDGASYALSLGIANGDFFSHIMAFSPGFMAPPIRRDSPPIFISHGDQDPILDVNACSRRLVSVLKKAEMKVFYHEFKGGHVIPPDLIKEAFSLFLNVSGEEFKATRVPVNEKEIRKT